MKNYSALSDFEINSAVHNARMDRPYEIEFLGNNKIRWKRGDTDVITDMAPYGKKTLKDYCNNPSDAWPILKEYCIDINWDGDSDSKPLRAAMIAYLMMKESEHEN